MFKRYVYTCPDMIHARSQTRKIAIATYVVTLVTVGVSYAYGRKLEKDIEQASADLAANPDLTLIDE